MFYSEHLLSKTGPLARVWLSANLERKLNKKHILETDIESSVNAIIDPNQPPMALRLSGQLLLGVARIYSRKARYLMDDCNDAVLRIKMASRAGNTVIDLLGPAVSTVPNPGLTVADELAGEIFFPTLDESLFNADPMDIDLGPRENDDPLNWTSQLPWDPVNSKTAYNEPEEQPGLYEDDLGLDFSIQMDQDVSARPEVDGHEEDGLKLYNDDLGITFDNDDGEQLNDDTELPIPEEHLLDNNDTRAEISEFRPQTSGSQSSLSSTRSSELPEVDQATTTRQPPAKKRKVLPMSREIVLKKQEVNRSASLKMLTLSPYDPSLLALITTMQQDGGFVSNGEHGLAPQLRGILSFKAIGDANRLKRRRDSGVADLGNEFPEEEADQLPHDEGVAGLSPVQLAIDDEPQFLPADDMDAPSPLQDNFDETTAPLLHPDEQGPISVGTQHAVHILREHFGGSAEAASSRTGALFQDLYPEAHTTKELATRMFFETLVLASKDAIQVEQSATELGSQIKIRPRRNLWVDANETELVEKVEMT